MSGIENYRCRESRISKHCHELADEEGCCCHRLQEEIEMEKSVIDQLRFYQQEVRKVREDMHSKERVIQMQQHTIESMKASLGNPEHTESQRSLAYLDRHSKQCQSATQLRQVHRLTRQIEQFGYQVKRQSRDIHAFTTEVQRRHERTLPKRGRRTDIKPKFPPTPQFSQSQRSQPGFINKLNRVPRFPGVLGPCCPKQQCSQRLRRQQHGIHIN